NNENNNDCENLFLDDDILNASSTRKTLMTNVNSVAADLYFDDEDDDGDDGSKNDDHNNNNNNFDSNPNQSEKNSHHHQRLYALTMQRRSRLSLVIHRLLRDDDALFLRGLILAHAQQAL